MDYLRDPSAIYEKSFAIIRSEADLSGLPTGAEAIAIRIIHACGMTDIVATCGFLLTLSRSQRKRWRSQF